MAAASKPCLASDLATMSTSDLRLQNTIAFFTSAPAIRVPSAARLALGSAVGMLAMNWEMFAAVVAGRETSMRVGSFRNWEVIRVISGGMVAEKNRVCRLGGVSLKVRSMSGMK